MDSTGNHKFARVLYGSYSASALNIKTDNDGNIYTTGVFHGTVDFDPGTAVSNLTTGFGTDIYISIKSNDVEKVGLVFKPENDCLQIRSVLVPNLEVSE